MMLNFTFNFSLDVLITFIPIAAGLALAFLVYGKNRNNLSNKIFSLSCLTIVLWTIANYFSRHPILLSDLSWIRLVMFFAVFMQFTFFLFVYFFPQNKISMSKWKFGILILLAFSTMAAALSPFLYPAMTIQRGLVLPLPGPAMPLFAFTIFLFLGLSSFYILKKYRLSAAMEKNQWSFIAFGFFIMFIFLIGSQFLAVIFFKETELIKFGPVFTMPFIILSAYAIIKHRLLNVRVIAAELLIASILLILLIQVFVAPTLKQLFWNLLLFIIVGILSVLLMRSILKEVQDKIQIQNLAESLKIANNELEKLSNAKSEFLSIASHQLRTPLTAIKGYISMIIEGTYGKLSPELLKPLKNVYESNEKLTQLVNDLLNLSRLEAGKIEFRPSLNSLEKIILGVINDLKINADKKGLYLKLIESRDNIPDIMADESKIRQVVLNIIDNAIKYTEKGGITVEIKKVGFSEQIIISDTGIGISQEDIKNLFQMFSRADSGAKLNTGGAGIGLHVAKKFIEMHNGRIWIESQGRGRGSTFYIELPIV